MNTGLFINNEFVTGAHTIDTINPSTGEIIASVQAGTYVFYFCFYIIYHCKQCIYISYMDFLINVSFNTAHMKKIRYHVR